MFVDDVILKHGRDCEGDVEGLEVPLGLRRVKALIVRARKLVAGLSLSSKAV